MSEHRIMMDVWRRPNSFDFSLLLYKTKIHIDGRGDMRHVMGSAAVVLDYKEVDRHTPIAPTFEIEYDDMQQWMDALWRAGVRPTKDLVAPESDVNLKNHLEDMRWLAFKALKLDVPGGRKT